MVFRALAPIVGTLVRTFTVYLHRLDTYLNRGLLV